MKEHKGKGLVDEETLPETQSQPSPSAGDKRKSLSKMIDLGNLPSRQGNKKAKHRSSKPGSSSSVLLSLLPLNNCPSKFMI